MFYKLIAVFFILAILHSTIYVSYGQFNGDEISLLIIEEEEHSQSENSSKSSENTFEFVFGNQSTLLFHIYRNRILNKENCYFQNHSKGENIKRLPDNPPEV